MKPPLNKIFAAELYLCDNSTSNSFNIKVKLNVELSKFRIIVRQTPSLSNVGNLDRGKLSDLKFAIRYLGRRE